MAIRIVYILRSQIVDGIYSLAVAGSQKEFIDESRSSQKVGYRPFRAFQVPESLEGAAYGICLNFIEGELRLEELTQRMSSLIQGPQPQPTR
jgi:hypothetical protein